MPCSNHCVAKVPFGLGASQERISNNAQCCGVPEILGLRLLEAGGKFVSVVDDLLGCARHWYHLRYFGRAAMAWMMIGPSALSMTPTSRSWPAVSAPTKNHEAFVEVVDEHRMVERVEHVVVVHAVLAGAHRDQRRIHGLQGSLPGRRIASCLALVTRWGSDRRRIIDRPCRQERSTVVPIPDGLAVPES